MKRRGLSSPDQGDCLAMSFASSPAATDLDEMSAEAAAFTAAADRKYLELRTSESDWNYGEP